MPKVMQYSDIVH